MRRDRSQRTGRRIREGVAEADPGQVESVTALAKCGVQDKEKM